MSVRNKRGFLYGSAVLMLSMAAVKLLGALFKIPLAALLRETGMGYFTSAYTIYTAVYALAVSGLSTATARMTSSCLSEGKPAGRILKASMLLFIGIGLTGSVAAALLAQPFSGWMGSPQTVWSVLTLSPAILFCCVMAAFRGYYEGCSDMRPTAVVQVIEAAVKVACGLLFAYLAIQKGLRNFAAGEAVYGTLCASKEVAVQASIPFASAAAMLGVTLSTAMGSIYLFVFHKRQPHRRAGSTPYRNICKELLRTAAPITLSAAVMQLSAMIDTVTIQHQLKAALTPGSPALAYCDYLAQGESLSAFLYGAFMSCMTLFHIVPAFSAVFGKSALPGITAAWTSGKEHELGAQVTRALKVTVLMAAPMAFGLAAVAKPALRLLYPSLPGMQAVGSTILPVLAAASFFFAFLAPYQAVMQGIGRADLPLKAVLCGAAVKLLANLTLVRLPAFHIMGAAIGTLLCYLTISVFALVSLKKSLPAAISVRGILIKPLLSATLSAFSAFLVQKALTNNLSNSIIAIVSIAVGAAVYIAALFLFRIVRRSDFSFVRKQKNT